MSKAVFDISDYSFECEITSPPLEIVRGEEPSTWENCPWVMSPTGIGFDTVGASFVIYTSEREPPGSLRLRLFDGAVALFDEELTLDNVAVDEPRGPGCGYRYKADAVINIEP